jgi:hypothetical protein
LNELNIEGVLNKVSNPSATPPSLATIKTEGLRQFWIEWKPHKKEYLDPNDDKPQTHPITLKRTAALAEMLKLPKPSEFSTLHCLGFFDDLERGSREQRSGWMFEIPAPVSSTTKLVSLYDISGDVSVLR